MWPELWGSSSGRARSGISGCPRPGPPPFAGACRSACGGGAERIRCLVARAGNKNFCDSARARYRFCALLSGGARLSDRSPQRKQPFCTGRPQSHVAALHARSPEKEHAAGSAVARLGATQKRQARAIRAGLDFWRQYPWVAPIPGTTNQAHLRENIGAAALRLSPAELREFDVALAAIPLEGHRADPFTQSQIDG